MPYRQKNRVKLQDIAQASGVSLTAVSLALSSKPGISQETRERVLEVARTLGYRIKSQVAAAPAKDIHTIGLLARSSPDDEPQANHFYSHIIAGVEAACRQMGINLMFAKLAVDKENYPLEIPPLLERGEVDGMLLVGAYIDEAFSRILDGRSCPVVLLDSYSSPRTYTAVLSDNISGGYQATEYLIQKGHRKIGFAGGHDRAYPSFRERREGYRKALAAYGIREEYLADCSMARCDAASAVTRLIAQNRQITGLVCVNDETAISGMYALIEAGISVPRQISIVGFDDIYLAETVVPSLSTMRVNKESMGKLAVRLLLDQVSQAGCGIVTSFFRPLLIERNSVAVLHP